MTALGAAPAAYQPATAPTMLDRSPAGLEQVLLTIRSGTKTHCFEVEIARSVSEQETGLMNRPAMHPDHGMIFPYSPAQGVAFWMKNTMIPLDMIFVAPGGKILRIGASAAPYSLEPVASGGEVEAVLELNGGRAASLGIRAGDQVDWKR